MNFFLYSSRKHHNILFLMKDKHKIIKLVQEYLEKTTFQNSILLLS